MRTIKFRGKRPNGAIIYGDLLHKRGVVVIAPTPALKFLVDENSVAQFVGVDFNGREVYEGDILLDDLENEHVAEIFDRPAVIKSLTLKETDHEKEISPAA